MATTISDIATEHAVYRRRIWLACIWAWPVCVVTFGVFFAVIAGFIPPPGESWSAAHIAEFYANNRAAIRAGLIGAMFASALLLPFFAVVSAEMKKIEGPNALLAPIQYGAAVMLTMIFQIICLFWLLASFRPEISPEIIRAFNDYGWLCWTIFIPTYSMQYVCMAIAAFIDHRPQPVGRRHRRRRRVGGVLQNRPVLLERHHRLLDPHRGLRRRNNYERLAATAPPALRVHTRGGVRHAWSGVVTTRRFVKGLP